MHVLATQFLIFNQAKPNTTVMIEALMVGKKIKGVNGDLKVIQKTLAATI
jgi:hypothetical protein